MNNLVLGIATYKEPEEGTQWYKEYHECVSSWNDTAWSFRPIYDAKGKRLIDAYEEIYRNTQEEIIGYVHNDVMVYDEAWDYRILKEFEDPNVGLVGLFGAKGHCRPNLYTDPFQIPNMVRYDCYSNMRTNGHGNKFTESKTVAVLDGYALFVRREVLDKTDGWNPRATYFMFAEWLSCETRRQGFKIRIVPLDHDHLGGRTSTTVAIDDNYEAAHRFIADNYSDVLPARVD